MMMMVVVVCRCRLRIDKRRGGHRASSAFDPRRYRYWL